MPKELAYIVKVLFSAVAELAKNEIDHGNIFPYQVHFL
jgi:hypothetical protein